MINRNSVTGRVAIGKLIGLVVGIIVLLFLPTFGLSMFSMIGLGTLIMFVIMGAMIGFMGQFDRHPLFGFKMSWYVRGPLVGFMFMLMYVLLSYDGIAVIMQSSLISWTGLTSPFWALLDGIIIGGFMGWAETKWAGEGPDLPLT